MPDFTSIYKVFNYAEGVIWIGVAVAVPLVFKMTTKNRKWGIVIASLGFVLFGVSDLLEATSQGDVPIALLLYKIACGGIILSGRFTYLGWKKFNPRDRYFLFGLFCLVAVSAIIGYRTLA